jgi:hypothetical protein
VLLPVGVGLRVLVRLIRVVTARGVPLRRVVRARFLGRRAPLLGLVERLLGLEPGGRVPLARGVGARVLRGDVRELLVTGRPRRRLVAARVVGGLVLRRVRVIVQRLLAAGVPLRGVVRTRAAARSRQVSEQGVGLEARVGAGTRAVGARVETGGGVAVVRGEVAVLDFLPAVRRVERRGGIGSRSRGSYGPRRVTVVHQLLFRLDNRGWQSSAVTVPGGTRARQSSAGFPFAGNGHSAVFRGTPGKALAWRSMNVRSWQGSGEPLGARRLPGECQSAV